MTKQIEQFVSLKKALIQEKATIEERLARINAALELAPSAASAGTPASKPKVYPRRIKTRAKNKLSLKAAVLQVTQAKPLTKEEILAGVLKLGYKFSTKTPLNSLGVVLYNKKLIRKAGGKFGPAK